MSDKRLLDKSWRVSNLYKIRDKNKQLIKFKKNRAQEHFDQNKWFRNIILKSRQLGFTTFEAIDSLDDVLFNKNTECLLIAHNLDAGKAIFDKKIELGWKNIHESLRNLYKVDSNTAQTLKFEYGGGSFSSIAVDTSGRSGTFNRVHVTEFADICKKYPTKAQEIIEGTIPAIPSDGRVDIESTSQGASGDFFDMFMEAYERGDPTIPVQFKAHFYNWQWDDGEIEKVTDEQIAEFLNSEDFKLFSEYQIKHELSDREITYYYHRWVSLRRNWNSLRREYPTTPEEAFEAIVEGTFYGEEIAHMERKGQIGIVPYDKALPVHTVWDLGVGENLVVGFYQRLPGQLRKIDYWQGVGSDGIPEAAKALQDKPYVYGKHFAPHDIKATDVGTGKSRIETAKKLGITFSIVPDMSVDNGINAATMALSHTWVDKESCGLWIKSMKNYVREWDDKRGMYKDTPFHNWASHGADEFRYAAIVEDQMTSEKPQPPPQQHIPESRYEGTVAPRGNENINGLDINKENLASW